jgi:hypothetical protein
MTTFLTGCGSNLAFTFSAFASPRVSWLPSLLIMCQSSLSEVRQRIHSLKPTGVKSLVYPATLPRRIELIVGHPNVYPMR